MRRGTATRRSGERSSSHPHVLMIFLDGVGIGTEDPSVNPFFTARLENLRSLLGGTLPHLTSPSHQNRHASLVPIHATLGMPGLPQSGTGQTALLTGVNAARMIGKHFGPYPYSTLKPVLAEKNIFLVLHDRGRSVLYANAYPRKFFNYIRSHRGRMAATTLSWTLSGFPLNGCNELLQGKALSADITGAGWHALGHPEIDPITPPEAGKRLARLSEGFDFVFFEYYFTDHAGHSQSFEEAHRTLELFDGLLGGVLAYCDFSSTLLLVTSDHGNIEDLSTKSHTRNPVPLLAVGARHKDVASSVGNLMQVAPMIQRILL